MLTGLFKTKKKTVKVNVEKLHTTLVTKRMTTYYFPVTGSHIKNNKFKSALNVMWDKLLSHQYIKVQDTVYLNTDDIAEIRIENKEEHIIEVVIKENSMPIFIS